MIMNKAYTELKKKQAAEFEKELSAASLELIKLRAQLVTGAAAKEVGKLHQLKKKVARIRTLQRENGGQ